VEDAIEEVRCTVAGHVVFRHDEPCTRVKDAGYISVLGLLHAGASAKTLITISVSGVRDQMWKYEPRVQQRVPRKEINPDGIEGC